MDKRLLLVVATRNRGKLKEFVELLKEHPVVVRSLDDFDPIPEVPETGETFEENAYQKASFVAERLGLPALADDSGLVVEALGGAPGVRSARYGGEGLTDSQRCERILLEMKDKENRRAAFECVLSLALPGGEAMTYRARCDGRIIDRPLGTDGFGYDPIFYYPPFEQTFAQISLAEKNRISHRGKALCELGRELDKVFAWIRRTMPEEPMGMRAQTKQTHKETDI